MTKKQKNLASDANVEVAGLVPVGSDDAIKLSVATAMTEADYKPLAKDFAVAFKLDEGTALQFVRDAFAILHTTAKLGGQYLTLCTLMRDKQIGPAQARPMLFALGFHKVKVSEIIRITSCADEVWKRFSARELGIKKVLQLERGSPMLAHFAAPEDELVEAGLEGEGAQSGGEAVDTGAKRETPSRRLGRMLKGVAAFASKHRAALKLPRVLDKFGNGIVITVEYREVGPGEVDVHEVKKV